MDPLQLSTPTSNPTPIRTDQGRPVIHSQNQNTPLIHGRSNVLLSKTHFTIKPVNNVHRRWSPMLQCTEHPPNPPGIRNEERKKERNTGTRGHAPPMHTAKICLLTSRSRCKEDQSANRVAHQVQRRANPLPLSWIVCSEARHRHQ